MTKKLTHEEFSKRVHDRFNGEIAVLSNYINKREKVNFKHTCGYVWSALPSNIVKAIGCPKCLGHTKLTHDDFVNRVKEKHNGKIEVIRRFTSTGDRLDFKCSCGNEWSSIANSIINGNGCPKCAREKQKITHDEYLRRVTKKHKGAIEVLGTYIDAHTKILHRHICGYEWFAAPYSVSNDGKGCLKCSGSMKKTHDEYTQEVLALYQGDIEVIGIYKNSSTKILHRHKCGHERMVKPKDILQGRECPKCAGKNKTQEDYIKQVFEKHSGDIEVLGEYTTARNKIKHKHKCGYQWDVQPADILNGYGCPKCGGGMKKTHDEYVKQVFDKYKADIEVLGSYVNAMTKILHKHVCGYVWKVRPNDILTGYACPHCKRSRGEILIRILLNELEVDFVEQYTPGDCKFKNPLRFDFAVFNHGKLKCLIEYDGMQHFKPTGFDDGVQKFELAKKRDLIKDKYCQNKSILLLRIPYWKSDQEVKQTIEELLTTK